MLGLSPEQAMDTPLVQIVMAIEAKVEWTIRTNPFGGGKKSEKRNANRR